MALIAPEHNPGLYLLSDHLDAVLARGEELLAQDLALDASDAAGLRDWIRHTRDLDAFVSSVRTLEYALTARLLQARKRADDLKRGDSRLKPLVGLFVGGTAPLADAAAELGESEARAFDGADELLAFLRSRGLLAPDAAGLHLLERLAVDEDYLVAGRIRLGMLLDLTATFLDALDHLYDLHGDDTDSVDLAAPRPPHMLRATSAEPSAAN